MVLLPAVLVFLTLGSGATVSGVVKSEDGLQPIEGVSVVVVGAGVEAISDRSGRYELRGVPMGWHRIRFARLGYRTREIGFRVGAAGPAGLDVALVVEPILLEPIQVEGTTSVRRSSLPRSPLLEDLGLHAATRADLTENPVLASSDVLEAVGALPTTEAAPGTRGAFHVKGGSADENLVLLDGTPILNPYHALGLASSISPDILGGFAFHAGIPPAGFGGRISSVLAIETRQPDPDAFHVSTGLENYSARITLDGPLPVRTGTFLLAGRHSYEGPLARRAEEEIAGTGFRDFFGKLSAPALKGVLEAMVLSADDELRFDARPPDGLGPTPLSTTPDAELLNRFGWSSNSRSLRWRREGHRAIEVLLFSAEGAARAEWDPGGTDLRMRNSVLLSGLRLSFAERSERRELEWGASLERQQLSYGIEDRDGAVPRVEDQWRTAALFAHGRQQLGERVGVSLGLRLTGRGGVGLEIEPRASVTAGLGRSIVAGIGFARMRQDVQSLRNEESLIGLAAGIDLLGITGAGDRRGAVSDQILASVSGRVAGGVTVSAEAYHRRLGNLVLVAPETPEPFSHGSYRVGSATAWGLGVGIDGVRGPLTTRVGYGYGRVRRAFHDVEYAPGFHHDHWVRAGTEYDWTDRWSLRLGVEAGSGAATSAQIGGLDLEPPDPVLGEGELNGTPRRIADPLNTLRSPWYVRLDGGFRYVWQPREPSGRGRLAVFATVRNLLNRKHVLAFVQGPHGALTPIALGQVGVHAGLEWRY